MPHLALLFTSDLERETDMPVLCRSPADSMPGVHDGHDRQVFPAAGTRVMAYPVVHHAVADGEKDHADVYLNLHPLFDKS